MSLEQETLNNLINYINSQENRKETALLFIEILSFLYEINEETDESDVFSDNDNDSDSDIENELYIRDYYPQVIFAEPIHH